MDNLALMALGLKIQTAINMIEEERDTLTTKNFMTCIQTHHEKPTFTLWDRALGTDYTALCVIKNGEIIATRYGRYSKVDLYIYMKELMEKDGEQ